MRMFTSTLTASILASASVLAQSNYQPLYPAYQATDPAYAVPAATVPQTEWVPTPQPVWTSAPAAPSQVAAPRIYHPHPNTYGSQVAYSTPQPLEPVSVPVYQAPQPVAPAYSVSAPQVRQPAPTTYANVQPGYVMPNRGEPMSFVRSGGPSWYAGLKGDVSFLEDFDATSSGTVGGVPTTINEEVEFDVGYGIGVVGGYRFNRHFRAEVEATYRDYDVDSVTQTTNSGGTVTTQTASGNDLGFEAITVFANGYLDYPIEAMPQLVPYVGAGLGAAFQRNGAEESGFAYQLMAGMAYEFPQNTVLALGYKFQQAPDIIDTSAASFDATNHNIEITLRQHF